MGDESDSGSNLDAYLEQQKMNADKFDKIYQILITYGDGWKGMGTNKFSMKNEKTPDGVEQLMKVLKNKDGTIIDNTSLNIIQKNGYMVTLQSAGITIVKKIESQLQNGHQPGFFGNIHKELTKRDPTTTRFYELVANMRITDSSDNTPEKDNRTLDDIKDVIQQRHDKRSLTFRSKG